MKDYGAVIGFVTVCVIVLTALTWFGIYDARKQRDPRPGEVEYNKFTEMLQRVQRAIVPGARKP